MIREEVERNLRWSAGISADGAKLNKPSRGINYGVPPGLGIDSGDENDTDKENEETKYEKEWSLSRHK